MMEYQDCKGLFTPNESGIESEKDQRTGIKDQRVNDKNETKFSLPLTLLFSVN